MRLVAVFALGPLLSVSTGCAGNTGVAAGSGVTTLASGQAGPLGIAVDSTSVYWTGESETGRRT
jgi:hypothetical protein